MTTRKIEIMDTTLRDGEQTSGVSFLPAEKLKIAKLLIEDLKVDRIEVASAKISDGEFEGVQLITEWAAENGYQNQIEILGFVDKPHSIDWIEKAGGKVINLLTKGSKNHVQHQLRKTTKEHLADAISSIEYANSRGIAVNVYLEDWSNGMKNSKDHVFQMVEELQNQNIQRLMLPDTLGILTHRETFEYMKEMVDRFPDIHFDFHGHNDYGLSIANVLEAVNAGASGIHATLNGLGERAGNPSTSSVIAAIKDLSDCDLNVDEKHLFRVSKLVEQFSGVRIPSNQPVIGENVFTQTCGVHADGDNKKSLYFNDLLPERFGRKRKYALGKTSGKANILKNLQEIGIDLTPEEIRKVTSVIIELGDKKKSVTKEDLPYIISDVLRHNSIKENIQVINYSMTSTMDLRPLAALKIQIDKDIHEESATGQGQYDAFMNALKKIYNNLNFQFPDLIDYSVSIPPGGETDALVETVITWEFNNNEFKTRGLDSDQTISAIKATQRMLNMIDLQTINEK